MLDMGTGGGEALSGLPDRAPRTVAAEAWPPNVPLAARRLLPLGIPVIQNEAAADNMDQDGAEDGGRLPFRDGSLDLICNRHESFLKAISWSIPGYSLENHRDRLRALHEDASAWPVMTSGHRFLLVASKPG